MLENKDKLVSFKTAKLAKEKGFEEICFAFFRLDALRQDIDSPYDWMLPLEQDNLECKEFYGEDFLLAPTQSLLQSWIRDIYKIYVHADANAFGWYGRNDNTPEPSSWNIDKRWSTKKECLTYEEALEEALLHALNTIK